VTLTLACSANPSAPASGSGGRGVIGSSGGSGPTASGGTAPQPGTGGISGTGGIRGSGGSTSTTDAALSEAASPATDASGEGSEARPAGDVPSPSAPRSILFIVGDENGTSPRGEGIGDKFVKTRLETVLGHKVTIGADNAAGGELQ
jgi:hypothetical protein